MELYHNLIFVCSLILVICFYFIILFKKRKRWCEIPSNRARNNDLTRLFPEFNLEGVFICVPHFWLLMFADGDRRSNYPAKRWQNVIAPTTPQIIGVERTDIFR